MKVYEKITIEIVSGEVVEEVSYNYDGPVAQLSSGSGGGGGGGSGKVDYPPYMKEIQADWLGGGDPDGSGLVVLTAGNDMASLLDSAIGSSPYASASAYDPSSEISEMDSALTTATGTSIGLEYLGAASRASDAVDTLDNFDDDTPFADADTQVAAYDTYLGNISTTNKIETELANFNSGMTDINAVNSSSFGIGHQIIAEHLIEAKLQAESDLTHKYITIAHEKVRKGSMTVQGAISLAQTAAQNDMQRSKLKNDERVKNLHYKIEVARLSIAASVEEANKNLKIDKKDAVWDLDIFQYGANLLASIGGGAVSKDVDDSVSDGQAALGGALSGAAMGSSIMPGWGTAAGAVIGGIGGALMN